MAATPRIQLAVSAIVEADGRYLLVKRGGPPDAENWAFPGGRVEPGETTRDAVIRELSEETGLSGSVDRVFDVYDFVADGHGQASVPFHFTLIVFHVLVDDTSGAEASSDAAALRWMLPDEAAQLPMPPSMHDAMKRLAAG